MEKTILSEHFIIELSAGASTSISLFAGRESVTASEPGVTVALSLPVPADPEHDITATSTSRTRINEIGDLRPDTSCTGLILRLRRRLKLAIGDMNGKLLHRTKTIFFRTG
jgi:hypothetical protein